jgi:hypothetical protein
MFLLFGEKCPKGKILRTIYKQVKVLKAGTLLKREYKKLKRRKDVQCYQKLKK